MHATDPERPEPARRRRKTRAAASQTAHHQSPKGSPPGVSSTGTPIIGTPSRRRTLLGALAVGGTIVGVLSSGTALFDWFGKTVNPVTPPPAKIDAQLTPPKVLSSHKPLGDYLSDTNQPTSGLSRYQLAEEGFEFLIGIHLQGQQGRSVYLKWSVIDNVTGNSLADPIYNQVAGRVVARGSDQAREWPIWVPSPPRRGRYVLRVILLDETQRPLVEADSEPFTVNEASGP